MLNELYALSDALNRMNIQTKSWHRLYGLLPKVSKKVPCFRICLKNNGEIANIETISEDLAATLRKFGDNQGTFPAFNTVPLYRLTDEHQKSELIRMLADNSRFDFDTVKSWCVADNWLKNPIDKLDRCLHTKSRELRDLITANSERDNQVTKLIEIAIAYKKNSFRNMLEACVFDQLQKREGINIYLQILFHMGDDKKSAKDDTGSISVILDLADYERYVFPIANEHTTEWLNDVLLKADIAAAGTAAMDNPLDAFGDAYMDVGEPMPSVPLLKGFDVKLRAMFCEQKSQYRYRKIDDESYPITQTNRAKFSAALNWLATPDKEGSTWGMSAKGEIVFAYPSILPQIPPKIASFFGAGKRNDSGLAEARFESIAKEVIDTLRGLPSKDKPDNIQVFSLRQIEPALSKRAKVVFNRNCSPEKFIQAAEEWQKGCTNLPKMDIRAFPPKNRESDKSDKSDKDDKPRPQLFDLLIPFPLQVPKIINTVWKQDGTTKASAKRMQYYEGMELLLDLDPLPMETIKNYLNVLLSHSIGLIQHAGNQQHRGLADSDTKARSIGNVLSVLGLLLCKRNYTKEVYMENVAYLVGQILKISDELHAFYCKIKRKGDVPPQLAGNSMFVTATETPNAAIKQLGVRMNPYIAWAKQYRTKPDEKEVESGVESPGLADWYIQMYENTATKLGPLLTSDTMRFSDLEKAQVFIGYLAAFSKNEK